MIKNSALPREIPKSLRLLARSFRFCAHSSLRAYSLKIIALDFYDGVIEGVASSLGEFGACYFRLIAWDENQDQRLFVVIPISILVFEALFEALSYCNKLPSTKIWLPNWSFRTDQDKEKANQLIELCKANLSSKAVLILGSQIESERSHIFMIDENLVSAVDAAMRKTEKLDDWISKLRRGKY